ncbi:hypothetical protein JXB02_03465 [Candidatus Woesearchaeota archaeon]|nr:hypothetical protein [Candidatus Woesearchaeota archaeon]
MGKQHLKRLATPRTWDIGRKGTTFVVRPNPGKSLRLSLPIAVVLKMIGAAKTTKECVRALNRSVVMVNQKQVKDIKLPVGLFDVLALKASGRYFRLVITDRGLLTPVEIMEEESTKKVLRIENKTRLKRGRLQLNLFEGTNVIVPEDAYQVGDSLLIEFPVQIKERLPLEKKMLVYIVGGTYLGRIGTVESVEGGRLFFRIGSESYETLATYAYVIGKTKPAITVTGGGKAK